MCLLMSTVHIYAVLQVAQSAAAAENQAGLAKGQAGLAKGQAELAKGQAGLAKGQTGLAKGQAEMFARLKSIGEKLTEPPTETVHDMVMALVNRPEVPESTVGLDDRLKELSRKLREMQGCLLGVAGMGGVGTFLGFENMQIIHPKVCTI